MGRTRPALLVTAVLLAGCGGTLPPDSTSFTAGNTIVRTDSALDLAGVVFRLADSARVPPLGPARHWLQALAPRLDDSAFALVRALGPVPVSLFLETWVAPDRPDTICGTLAPGERRCFTGNEPVRAGVRRFLAAAAAFAPRAAAIALEDVNHAGRHRDLEDVYTALTRGKALDSTVIAYAGYDLRFDVTLARTVVTGQTTPGLDPARALPPDYRIFLTPDAVFPQRAFRSPTYVWLNLGHQMVHAAVRRLFAEHPELVERTIRLRPAIEGEMVRSGYNTLLWDEALGEQLARAMTVRVLSAANPTITWAARAEALSTNMALVPYIEDALAEYEASRDQYPTLSDFAPRLLAALDRVPLDSCRAAPFAGVALVGVARNRAVVGWIERGSPYAARGLLVGDTVVAVDGDSVSAGGLMLPSRQLAMAMGQHLPFELGIIGIRRRGRSYDVTMPIQWAMRPVVRVASQNRAAAADLGASGACRWVRRVLR